MILWGGLSLIRSKDREDTNTTVKRLPTPQILADFLSKSGVIGKSWPYWTKKWRQLWLVRIIPEPACQFDKLEPGYNGAINSSEGSVFRATAWCTGQCCKIACKTSNCRFRRWQLNS